MALSVSEVRGHVATQLGDDELGRLVASAYSSIAEYAPDPMREFITGYGDLLMLSRPAGSVTAIVERGATVDADDYELIGSHTVRRLCRRWRGRIDVTYALALTDADRDRVALALVQLDLNYRPGVTGERLGDWQVTLAANSVFNYKIEREAVLESLFEPGAVFV